MSTDATMGYVGGVSWEIENAPIYPKSEFTTLVRESPDATSHIAECEFLAAVIAAIYWSRKGSVTYFCAPTIKTCFIAYPGHVPTPHAPNRLLRHPCLRCLTYGVDVPPFTLGVGGISSQTSSHGGDHLNRTSGPFRKTCVM